MRRFVTWWLNQLAGMFAIASAHEHADAIILEIDSHTVNLLYRSGGITVRQGQSSADETGIRELAQLVTEHGTTPLLVRFRPAQALHKKLSLPIAARHDLKEALGFEIDRETPFSRDEVHWHYIVHRRCDSRNRLDVDLAIVPRSLVDPIIDCARRAGLNPSGIEVDLGPNAATSIPLGRDTRVPWDRSQRKLACVGGVCCMLAIIAIALPFIAQQQALSSADAVISSLKEPAREALALRRPTDQLAKVAASVRMARKANGSALTLLSAATRSLPDDTFLTAFRLHDGRITMSGLSPSAAKLVGFLVRAPSFRAPTLDAPVVESGSEGLETFTISVNVPPESAP